MESPAYSLQDSVTVLGKRWKLQQTNQIPKKRMADCDPPWKTGKTIRIRRDLEPRMVFRCLVHEMIHASGWHIDEEYVERLAEDIEREAVRNGFIK